MAVGARVRDVPVLVLREGIALSALGVLLGAGAALLAACALGSLPYGVTAADPLSYGLALLLLPFAALLGCGFPAWRAASVSPAEIIRRDS